MTCQSVGSLQFTQPHPCVSCLVLEVELVFLSADLPSIFSCPPVVRSLSLLPNMVFMTVIITKRLVVFYITHLLASYTYKSTCKPHRMVILTEKCCYVFFQEY